MSYSDVMDCTVGMMVDMINLLSVYNGAAKERKVMTFDEVIRLR